MWYSAVGFFVTLTLCLLTAPATHAQQPVKTFSVGFGEWINELPYARAVADAYRTEHHAIDLGTPAVVENTCYAAHRL